MTCGKYGGLPKEHEISLEAPRPRSRKPAFRLFSRSPTHACNEQTDLGDFSNAAIGLGPGARERIGIGDDQIYQSRERQGGIPFYA